MISVAEALDTVFELVARLKPKPCPWPTPPAGSGRTAVAPRDQPPFAASAMDGYAVKYDEVTDGAQFNVIGEAAAGQRICRCCQGRPGGARSLPARRCPKAPIACYPRRCHRDGAITLRDGRDNSAHVRPAGGDFRTGTELSAPRRIGARGYCPCWPR